LDIVNARHAVTRISPFCLVERYILPSSGRCFRRFVSFDLLLNSVFAYVGPLFSPSSGRCFDLVRLEKSCSVRRWSGLSGPSSVFWIQYLPSSGCRFRRFCHKFTSLFAYVGPLFCFVSVFGFSICLRRAAISRSRSDWRMVGDWLESCRLVRCWSGLSGPSSVCHGW
jgi:hypothetical protein